MAISARRRALEKMYKDRLTAYRFEDVTVGYETVNQRVDYLHNIPCRLARVQLKPAEQTPGPAAIAYAHVIICAPEHEIPAGCEIEVLRMGRDAPIKFEQSGEGMIYTDHQEIPVRREGKA